MAARSQPLAFKDWQSKPGDLHLETFKEKGRGSYGVVRVGEWRGSSVAVKTLHDILLEAGGRQKEELVKSFKEECLKLRRLDDHRRVVKLIATFRDERGRPLLVMEALEESLEDYLLRNVGKLSVLRQISIVSELADGLAYLHENNIVHRDLKPANVLMGKDGHIRIADLGQAKLLANIEQLMTTLQPGTILFLPPETLQDGGSPYTFSIDCFSLGVVALCVATQSLPTCGFAQIGTVEEAVRRKKDLDKLPKGHPLKAIILGCLQNTPSLRPRSFFIKEHTQALMEIEGCRSRLEERDKTVIQLREELQTQKEQTEYLRGEKEMKIEVYKSRLEERDRAVIQQEQKLQIQKKQIEYLQRERETKIQEILKQSLIPDNPPAAMPYGRPEVACFHNAGTSFGLRSTQETTIQEKRSLMPDNPLALVPLGSLEVACFHNAQILDSGAHKVVAFGITGHGKSSFLNFLLNDEKDVFSTSRGLLQTDSVTKETQACPAMIGGEQWMLIDTPGFFDSDQLQDGIGESLAAQVQEQKQEFCSHIMQAYLEAGKEVSAFLLVYNGSTRWALEMSQQIKFLNSIQFPWSHCILVITHADAALKGIPDEQRRYEEFIKAVGDPQSKLPEQLNQLIRNTSNRVILVESVESLKKGDGYHASVVTRIKGHMSEIEEKHGKYRNELFAIFEKRYNADCHEVYMSLLQKKDELQQLVRITKEDATGFILAGQNVAKDHEELIRMMEVIAQLADQQRLTPEEEKTVTKGKVLAAIGMPIAVAASLFMPVTFGLSAIAYGVGGGVGVVLALTGIAMDLPSLVQSLRTRIEVRQAQSCLEQGRQSLQELYHSHYQSLLMKIDEAGLIQHPSANDSLVAHLLAVHAHDSRKRSPELLQAAQELGVFHTLRNCARGEIPPEQATNISGKCALPIGFNILAKEMDVAQAVSTTLHIVSISTNSTTMDATLLRSSCIQTLRKERNAIQTLCNIRD